MTAKVDDPDGKFAISVKDTMELRIFSCEYIRQFLKKNCNGAHGTFEAERRVL